MPLWKNCSRCCQYRNSSTLSSDSKHHLSEHHLSEHHLSEHHLSEHRLSEDEISEDKFREANEVARRHLNLRWVSSPKFVAFFGLALAMLVAGCESADSVQTQQSLRKKPLDVHSAGDDTEPSKNRTTKSQGDPSEKANPGSSRLSATKGDDRSENYSGKSIETVIAPDQVIVECQRPPSESTLREIFASPQLRTLILDGGGLPTDKIPELSKLQDLRHLRVRNCPVSDRDLEPILGLEKLIILNLPQACLRDDGLKQISKRLPQLQLLRFSSPDVTDQGIAYLKNLRNLRALHLIGVPVTDQSIGDLCEIESLETFYVDGGSISEDGFRTIYKLRPDLHVHVDQVHLDFDPGRHDSR